MNSRHPMQCRSLVGACLSVGLCVPAWAADDLSLIHI